MGRWGMNGRPVGCLFMSLLGTWIIFILLNITMPSTTNSGELGLVFPPVFCPFPLVMSLHYYTCSIVTFQNPGPNDFNVLVTQETEFFSGWGKGQCGGNSVNKNLKWMAGFWFGRSAERPSLHHLLLLTCGFISSVLLDVVRIWHSACDKPWSFYQRLKRLLKSPPQLRGRCGGTHTQYLKQCLSLRVPQRKTQPFDS